jgi:superfamily II DNA or RNA helicase
MAYLLLSSLSRKRQWDGYVRYISEVNGLFATGLLDQVIALMDSFKYRWKIIDQRDLVLPNKDITSLGKITFRPDQLEAISLFKNNKLAGIPFLRGIMAEATNAGKSIIAAGIIGSFSNKKTSILLTNSKDLYNQLLKDFKKIFGKAVGQVNSTTFDWQRINICMVQTLSLRIKKFPQYRNALSKVDIVLVDEGDLLIGMKGCKQVLANCYDAPVRLSFSGTSLKHKGKVKLQEFAHKGDPKNQEQLAFFGPIIHRISNKELVDLKISTPPKISMLLGNSTVKFKGEYTLEYEKGIVKNKLRNRRVWERVRYHLKKGHEHGRRLMKSMPEDLLLAHSTELLHGKIQNRKRVFHQFSKGKVDVLICSMIVRRGLNYGIMKVLINAAGGDSEANVLQLLGRALRKHKDKKRVWVDDFYDIGDYLLRHSKHRLKAYKDEAFEVRERYKTQINK